MEFKGMLDSIGEVGVVVEVNHTVITLVGLPGAHLHEIIIFENGAAGEVFIMDEETISVLLFIKKPIIVGTKATRTNQFISVPVGASLLGALIDPLGNPLEESVAYKRPTEMRELEAPPPTMYSRVRVNKSFFTGVSVVDMMVPLGRGQRELVIGDRKTGKSSFVLASIKAQVQHGAIAIYAAIGRQKSDIKEIQRFMKEENIASQCVIVATSSYDAPGFIYLTPYSAMAIAEHFRDQGRDVVIVFDDLSTHAEFYREISLLAKRFPGRESYPGDIFAIHARLLERAGNFKHPNGEVSITALPLVEIVQGDFTGYIPTNLMSITDGHIYFDSNVYYQGRRPAVNISLSVTRVGRQSQSALSRRINRELTAFLALYDRMQNLSHFGAELTDTVQHIIKTGDLIYTFFKQPAGIVIPHPIQIVFFSMLWLKLFDGKSTEMITSSRNLLAAKYLQDERVRKFMDELISVETFNDLLGAVTKQRDKLLELCKTNTN